MADRLINVFRKSELNDYLESAEKTAGWIKNMKLWMKKVSTGR